MRESHRQPHSLQDRVHLNLAYQRPKSGLVQSNQGIWTFSIILSLILIFGHHHPNIKWVKVSWNVNFLMNKTRYVSNGSNHPNDGILNLITLMSMILVIHLDYESSLLNIKAFID